MLLFVGLGNPGARYAGNRHNVGFMAIDAIAHRFKAATWRKRFQSESTECVIGTEKALLLKPETFMNNSGQAVQEAAQFYKIALSDIIVFHDELDLAPGKVRVKLDGGNAGHNGLRSITQHCGNAYRRVRIGIGHPGHKDAVHPWVLNDFSKEEREWVSDLCEAMADHAELLAKHLDSNFQSKIHLAMEAKGWKDAKDEKAEKS
jgi:PTH1 family peptidyl-tRNA hydrolase